MKRLLALVAVVTMTGVALANGGISGTVLNAVTSDPIEGAMVIAVGDSGEMGRARTNARGAYRIGDLAPGLYRVAAQARGYEPVRFPRPVGVREGEVTGSINFGLRPHQHPNPGAITGRIVDRRTGEPIAGAKVVAYGRSGRRKARTDEHGRYAIRGLRPGTYRVKARARGYVKAAFPRPIDLRPGQTVEDVNFALVPKLRRGAIAGQVIDARTQRPIAGAVVFARGEHGSARVVADRHGYYRMRLKPGVYRVTAFARGYRQETFPRPVPVHPHRVTRGINFHLHRSMADSD